MGDPLVVDAVGEQIELAHAPREVEVVLAAIPVVVDDRDHLVGERLGAIPRLAIGIRDVAEHRVEVRVEAVGEVVALDALAGDGGEAHECCSRSMRVHLQGSAAGLSTVNRGTQCHSRARRPPRVTW